MSFLDGIKQALTKGVDSTKGIEKHQGSSSKVETQPKDKSIFKDINTKEKSDISDIENEILDIQNEIEENKNREIKESNKENEKPKTVKISENDILELIENKIEKGEISTNSVEKLEEMLKEYNDEKTIKPLSEYIKDNEFIKDGEKLKDAINLEIEKRENEAGIKKTINMSKKYLNKEKEKDFIDYYDRFPSLSNETIQDMLKEADKKLEN